MDVALLVLIVSFPLAVILAACVLWHIFNAPPLKKPAENLTRRQWVGIAWVALLAIAVAAAWIGPQHEAAPDRSSAASPSPAVSPRSEEVPIGDILSSTCLVFAFESGKALDANAASVSDKNLVQLAQEPSGCFRELRRRVSWAQLRQMILVGRADRAEFIPGVQSQYVNNGALALDRARTVLDVLKKTPYGDAAQGAKVSADEIEARTVLITAGPEYTDNRPDRRLLMRDRGVEIRTYWSSPPGPLATAPAPNSADPLGVRTGESTMPAEEKLALLALYVALSAYLATIGLFLRDQVSSIEKDLKAHGADTLFLEKRKQEIRQRLMALTVTDLPMIAAAIALTVHVLFVPAAGLLRASLVLASSSALCLVLLHGAQWKKTYQSL